MVSKEATSGKEETKVLNTLSFLGSWFLTLILGIIFCVYLFYSVSLVFGPYGQRPDSVAIRIFITYSFIATTTLITIWILLRKARHIMFIRHTSWAVLAGSILNCLILLVSLAGALIATNTIGACTSINDQLSKIQSATVPIATDKGYGTAVAINGQGNLLTAYHVIDGASRVTANYVGNEAPIEVVSVAPEYDLALLRITKFDGYFAELSTQYALGDTLYAFGYPGNAYTGGQASLSAGILSRVLSNDDLRLNVPTIPAGLEVIQTDAAINPGNSGGPLFNSCGVIGIISSKSDLRGLQQYGLVSEEGISFAISSKSAISKFGLPTTK